MVRCARKEAWGLRAHMSMSSTVGGGGWVARHRQVLRPQILGAVSGDCHGDEVCGSRQLIREADSDLDEGYKAACVTDR